MAARAAGPAHTEVWPWCVLFCSRTADGRRPLRRGRLVSDAPPPLPEAIVREALAQMTAETQTFIKHYALSVELRKEALRKAGLTEAKRATAFAVGCQHLADPIRRDIQRLQRNNPEPAPHRAWPWRPGAFRERSGHRDACIANLASCRSPLIFRCGGDSGCHKVSTISPRPRSVGSVARDARATLRQPRFPRPMPATASAATGRKLAHRDAS